MTCGYGDSASYELLVNKIVNVKIDKSARFTNWENRPLNEKQIKYAISDVTHLSKIYLNLLKSVHKKKNKAQSEKLNQIHFDRFY